MPSEFTNLPLLITYTSYNLLQPYNAKRKKPTGDQAPPPSISCLDRRIRFIVCPHGHLTNQSYALFKLLPRGSGSLQPLNQCNTPHLTEGSATQYLMLER